MTNSENVTLASIVANPESALAIRGDEPAEVLKFALSTLNKLYDRYDNIGCYLASVGRSEADLEKADQYAAKANEVERKIDHVAELIHLQVLEQAEQAQIAQRERDDFWQTQQMYDELLAAAGSRVRMIVEKPHAMRL